MIGRFADVTGTIATMFAGAVLAVLSLSNFGAASSVIGFCALYLLGAAAHRAITRRV